MKCVSTRPHFSHGFADFMHQVNKQHSQHLIRFSDHTVEEKSLTSSTSGEIIKKINQFCPLADISYGYFSFASWSKLALKGSILS